MNLRPQYRKTVSLLLILSNFGWNDRTHARSGNVAMVDGSVQMLANARLAALAAQTGDRGSGQAGQMVISPGGNVILVP